MAKGAKSRLARLQNRDELSCAVCGDDLNLGTCKTCGDILCRDCKLDHDCSSEEEQPRKAKVER